MPPPATSPARPQILDYALLLLLATLWGASYTFIKIGVATIPPVTFIAARTLIAGLLLVAIMRLRGVRLPKDLATWRQFAFQASMNSVVPFTLIAWAELTVDAGLAAILNSTSPIFTFLLTFAVTRHEPASPWKFFGVAAGLAGIALIIGFDAFGGFGAHIVAELAIVLATICYAIAAIFGRRFHGLDPMAPAAGSLIAGAALLVPLSHVDRPWNRPHRSVDPPPFVAIRQRARAARSSTAARDASVGGGSALWPSPRQEWLARTKVCRIRHFDLCDVVVLPDAATNLREFAVILSGLDGLSFCGEGTSDVVRLRDRRHCQLAERRLGSALRQGSGDRQANDAGRALPIGVSYGKMLPHRRFLAN